MTYHRVAIFTGLVASVWLAVAAPETAGDAGPKPAEKSVDELIADLAADPFRIREEANRKLWEIGEPALSALETAADGKDPEQAYRARDLMRKIQLHITPETDPAVISLVERYEKASANEKVTLFDQMYRRRAWRQILKLYAGETSPDARARLQQMLKTKGSAGVEGVAVVAAREALGAGNARLAKEYLEMAPAEAPGLLALADFHRSQGTLDAELQRAKTLPGIQGQAWQLALHRAAGNLAAAKDAADAAGETQLSFVISTLRGDPVPWLSNTRQIQDIGEIHKPYTDLAIRRWQGKAIRQIDRYLLELSIASGNRSERMSGINTLFLLGDTQEAEAAMVKTSPLAAFSYFESLERVSEAFRTLGLDPDKPDFRGWVEKRAERLSKGEEDNDEQNLSPDSQELAVLANFMDRRGLIEEAVKAFEEPLIALAEQDDSVFTDLLSSLFGDGESTTGAPQLAKRLSITWAGDQPERWEEVVTSAFGGDDETLVLWEWLADLDPAASRADRLDAMLALASMGPDPKRLRERWLGLAWEAIRKTPAEDRPPLLVRMGFVANRNGDAVNNLKLWEYLPEERRIEIFWRVHVLHLSAVERWGEAAEFHLKQIERISKAKQAPSPELHAAAAACLRKAGKPDEAIAHDEWAEKLALGNDALEIGNAYAFGYDYTRAADWWARSARQSDPNGGEHRIALRLHADMLLESGDWLEAGSVSEVLAQMMAATDSNTETPLASLRIRLQADMGRALAGLKNDRAGSVAVLDKCHKMFPGDGSLADVFFPAIRRMGLTAEHDAWFAVTWQKLTEVVERYPDSDNTRNTAGWLASRAKRQLGTAQTFLEKALAMNPDQSAYLDTMAEIQFAKGDRGKALEWSSRAVNFMPLDPMLRRQHERFRSAPLPR